MMPISDHFPEPYPVEIRRLMESLITKIEEVYAGRVKALHQPVSATDAPQLVTPDLSSYPGLAPFVFRLPEFFASLELSHPDHPPVRLLFRFLWAGDETDYFLIFYVDTTALNRKPIQDTPIPPWELLVLLRSFDLRASTLMMDKVRQMLLDSFELKPFVKHCHGEILHAPVYPQRNRDDDAAGVHERPYAFSVESPLPESKALHASPRSAPRSAPRSTWRGKIPSITDTPPNYVVWFGTNRKPVNEQDLSLGFTGDRDPTVRYGTCQVKVPKSHKFGSTGSVWWKRWLTWEDDRLKLLKLTPYAEAAFWQDLSQQLMNASEKQALIYIHGYNVSFENAAIRAAQIGVDLKVPGIMGFFSWPSKGSTQLYTHDESAVEASEAALTDFLLKFAARTGAEKVHVIAHSMGNRGFLRALQRIQAYVNMNQKVKFGQIFLAAPDVDVEVFKSLAHLYRSFSERTTLYVSGGDKALGASQWLHGYARAGLTPPVTVIPDIDTVEVPLFDLLSLGHSFYADAAGPLNDIFHLLRHNAAPGGRQRLQSATTLTGETYWTMRE